MQGSGYCSDSRDRGVCSNRENARDGMLASDRNAPLNVLQVQLVAMIRYL
jgi:hypothetical protein